MHDILSIPLLLIFFVVILAMYRTCDFRLMMGEFVIRKWPGELRYHFFEVKIKERKDD